MTKEWDKARTSYGCRRVGGGGEAYPHLAPVLNQFLVVSG